MRFGVVSEATENEPRLALFADDGVYVDRSGEQLLRSIDHVLQTRVRDLQKRLDGVSLDALQRLTSFRVLPPVGERQEIWASGVTYERSRDARVAESTQRTVYDLVYEAERPELFFKALGRNVTGPDDAVGIRADSTWNVPEPELVVAANSFGEVVGYSIGNDMSSRSIEGANPLYLPQAKVFRRSCAVGPAILPAWQAPAVEELEISMRIERGRMAVFEGSTSVGRMRRSTDDLLGYLFRALDFPYGVLVLTGTGIVPPDDFTLEEGDEVVIRIEPIGELRNRVVRIGAGEPIEAESRRA